VLILGLGSIAGDARSSTRHDSRTSPVSPGLRPHSNSRKDDASARDSGGGNRGCRLCRDLDDGPGVLHVPRQRIGIIVLLFPILRNDPGKTGRALPPTGRAARPTSRHSPELGCKYLLIYVGLFVSLQWRTGEKVPDCSHERPISPSILPFAIIICGVSHIGLTQRSRKMPTGQGPSPALSSGPINTRRSESARP
jgi:hypothetical protein